MDMRKCNVCGEMYSTTYRTCPFCEEEAALRRGKPIHRSASDYRNRRGGHALGILLLVAVLILAGWGGIALWGDSIGSALGIRDTHHEEKPGGEDADPSTGGVPGDVQTPDDADPDGEPAAPDTPVALSSTEISIASVGQAATLTVSGGSGSYTFSSDNPQIAAVSPEGVITAAGSGTATISVTDGYTTAQCIVQVSGGSSGGGQGGSSGLTINREDMTLPVGTTWKLKITGTSSAVSWSIADASVATIDADGTVRAVKRGTTTATASVDGQTLECIVRVS